jgi:hypothetical protein
VADGRNKGVFCFSHYKRSLDRVQRDPDETRWELSEDANMIFSPEDLTHEVEDYDNDLEWEDIDWAEGTKDMLSEDFYRTRVLVIK